MAKETKQTESKEIQVVDFSTFNIQQLPEFKGKKEEIKSVIKANPVVKITDNASYELAKKSRTAVRSTRTGLENEKKEVANKIKTHVLNVVNNEYDLLIEEVRSAESLRQEEVTRWEDIKEQERLEKTRIEQERIDGIKAKIKSFADLFNSKIENLTFEGIDDFKAEFDEFVLIQPKDAFQEFEVLYNDMLSHVTYSFSQKKAVLLAQEQNRLEQVRLAEERAENERKEEIRNEIQSWHNNWSSAIDGLDYLGSHDLFAIFQKEPAPNYFEFQSEYAEKRSLLIQKFESKIALLQQIEDNRIASEKLAKEKAEFEAKQLEAKYQERLKQFLDLGFIEMESVITYPDKSFFCRISYLKEINEEEFDKFLANTQSAILREQKEKEPIVVDENYSEKGRLITENGALIDTTTGKPYESRYNKNISEIEVIGPDVVDKEDLGYRIDIENIAEVESWESIHDDFVEFTEIDDSINFYYWLKDNFEVPKRLIK